MKYQSFIFKSYHFDTDAKRLTLVYALDDALTFTESYHFDFDFIDYATDQLDRALQNLFFMAGVSYYKTYVPEKIDIRAGQLDQASAEFFTKTYQRGLGEFFYVNQLDPHTAINFPSRNDNVPDNASHVKDGLLIGLGGGKDSLVSIELLRNHPNVATWSLGHRSLLEPLVEVVGLPHFWVEREWDKQLLELNQADAYNGHVPISAIFACVGSIVGVLAGYSTAVVSNENSANEPSLQYQDVAINHQYSKSLEFEKDYQALLEHDFGDSLRYFSFLRPLSELRIAELFASVGFEKYKGVFSSCNRAFVHGSESLFWCGECPKCAFTFLALTPFIERDKLESLWHGKNLLLDPSLEPTYRQLLGIAGDKPLDCVGEVKESRSAMREAQKLYPELAKYEFEIPEGYNYKTVAPDSMPDDLRQLLLNALDN